MKNKDKSCPYELKLRFHSLRVLFKFIFNSELYLISKHKNDLLCHASSIKIFLFIMLTLIESK